MKGTTRKITKRSFKASLEHRHQVYVLKGAISLRQGIFPSEVEITSINDLPSHQILPGMPEIPYTYTFQRPLILPARPVAASFTRKMDGTAILFSALQLPDGEVAVFPRTRGMVTIQDTPWRPFRSLLNQAVTEELFAAIRTVCLQQKATLVFELWGNQNQHTVQYDQPLNLSLHTMIKGRMAVQPWRLLKQVAAAYKIPTVEELLRVKQGLSETELIRLGEELVSQQEQENHPELGLYRQEGAVLNVETPGTGWQWKFKPPSMEDYHRIARSKICAITVFHSLWELVDRGEEVSLPSLQQSLLKEYGQEVVGSQEGLIESQYWLWLSKYYQLVSGLA
jgi:hypothetical protein